MGFNHNTILDSLVEARIIAFKKIKQFQKKLKKKKTYKTLSLSVGDLVLEYCSNRDNVYSNKFSSQWKGLFIVNKVLNNGSYILQDQFRTIFNNHPVHEVSSIDINHYFLDQNIQNTFYTFYEYWIKNYPNTTLTIGKQTTITDNNKTHTVTRPKKTTTKREKIGSKMDKYLLESITAAILPPSNTIGKTLQEILPIDKNLSYGRQLELYGHLGEIIEDMKLIKKTTSEIQAEILGIIWLDVLRVLTIARRAKTLIQRFGLLNTKLISPQVLYTLSTKDFNKLVSFELDKTIQIDYLMNSLISLELNLFGEDDVMLITPICNTAFEISDLVFQVGGCTCFIPCFPESYQYQCFAVVIFDSLESLNVAVLLDVTAATGVKDLNHLAVDCKKLPPLPPKLSSNTSDDPKVFKLSFARSKFYAKAAVFVVPLVAVAANMDLDLNSPSKTTTPMLSAVSFVSNSAVESRLASLESHLSELFVFIKSLVEPVGTLVVLVTKLLSTPPTVNVSVKECVAGLARQNKGLAAVASMIQKKITHLEKNVSRSAWRMHQMMMTWLMIMMTIIKIFQSMMTPLML
ncbi:hypothetical protein G9A89_009717 [Geosiphon pyriformis]|nr:hypothetical protein G9A89_009717 [Geosiphon pyriformis]